MPGLISQSRRDPKQVEVDALVLGIVAQPGVENRPGLIGTVLCDIRNCNHIKDGELMRANPGSHRWPPPCPSRTAKKNGVVNGQIIERYRVSWISLSPHL